MYNAGRTITFETLSGSEYRLIETVDGTVLERDGAPLGGPTDRPMVVNHWEVLPYQGEDDPYLAPELTAPRVVFFIEDDGSPSGLSRLGPTSPVVRAMETKPVRLWAGPDEDHLRDCQSPGEESLCELYDCEAVDPADGLADREERQAARFDSMA